MSTRSVIAKATPQGWEGPYVHMDGYPTWMGPTLWEALHGTYKGNVDAFILHALDEHPKGYSSFPDRCYCHSFGREHEDSEPQHDMIYTQDDESENAALHIEWVYIFYPESLTILASLAAAGSLTRHGNGGRPYEEPHYKWVCVCEALPYTEKAPDWQAIEDATDARRESAHRALRR